MRRILTIICLLSACGIFAQQEILNTQFGYNKLAYNPAYAGIEGYTTLTSIVRDQWNGIPGAPENQLISASIPLRGQRVGLGFVASRYAIGIQERLNFRAIYAYRFTVGPGVLSLGLEASSRRYNTDFTDDRLLAIDGFDQDPSLIFEKVSLFTFNVGTGVYYRTQGFYFGISAPRLFNPSFDNEQRSTITKEERHYYVAVGNLFDLRSDWDLNTQILFKAAENAPYDIDLQAGLIYKNDYHIGLNYRFGGNTESLGESIAILFGIQPLDPLFFGFSYDFTLSTLRRYDTGSLEAMIQYSFGKKKQSEKIINPRYF